MRFKRYVRREPNSWELVKRGGSKAKLIDVAIACRIIKSGFGIKDRRSRILCLGGELNIYGRG